MHKKTGASLKTLTLFFSLIIISNFAYSKEKLDSLVSLTVVIEGIRSDNGNIRVHLYEIGNHYSFPDKSTQANYLQISDIEANKSIVTFENLSPSTYAFTVHHDENLNVKMDRNLIGLPTEGWALSNNVKPLFKLPSFKECAFELRSNKKISISINY